MTSTALPKRTALNRNIPTDSSTESSACVSPSDSLRPSPSSTSLSSLASDAQEEPLKLVDTYGNPFEIPDFTIKQIRDAIPAHCFKRSALRSLSYVARDISALAGTFYLFHNYVTPEYIPSTPIRAGLWGLYTFVQGLFGTGLWVMAHECGHQAFSPFRLLNDTVGWICHSALLVPYFSWKISHSKHHKATGNMDRDMVFVPKTREVFASRYGYLAHELHELMEETPHPDRYAHDPAAAVRMALPEGRGKGKKNGFFSGVNHFNPSSPLYEAKHVPLILLSDLGLMITGSALYWVGQNFGWANLAVWYFVPYLWVNHWLVAITYLQHTDPTLPHYASQAWTFTRGAAATIDREFGFIGRYLFHGIIETHVLHHYVSTIPFYNADEASEAIKPVMGKHYRSDTKDGSWGFIKSLWKSARTCHWVEPCEGAKGEGQHVYFFRNRNNIGVRPSAVATKSS
ncbi:omega-6 fatty acid desaturase (delta-12 desaturase) [Blastomyces dermatitidis ATCC 18188]|uniref:Omega-6 fatty acid desaturase (Delta-12 desaturase) n=1 Tax=Ajellomyces dermatitidis (strain ATCC 18188 / CBS 674.68) TaxID=653446 RepID=F2T585_AJEDA|nr:omega-6 fatty acid desaturase (delta-12 desaturase) [Blastomyces dermatitidis ATCC 18188]